MRRPTVGRLIAGLFAATIVSLMFIDTTMACRFLFRHRACNPCSQVTVCSAPAVSYTAATCPPVECPPVDCCGEPVCGGEVVTDSWVSGGYVTESYDSGIPIEAAATPIEGTIISERVIDEGAAGEGVVDEGTVSEVPEPEDTTAPEPELAEPEDDTLDELPAAEDSFDEMPADELDLGDMPADEAPADDSAFGEAPADDTLPGLDAPAEDDAGLPGFEEAPADDAGLPGFDDAPVEDDAGLPGFDDAPADDALPGFDEPLDDAVPADEGAEDSLDDLFGAKRAPQIESVPVAELDAQFGFSEVSKSQPVVQPLAERVWTDNTGQYKTVGRLVKIGLNHVRLLKDNGRFSTVPKNRLSQTDLDYVQQMTAQLGIEDFDRLASR